MQIRPNLRLNSGWGHALSVLGGFTLLYVLFFSPVLFSERLLGRGDGFIQYEPLFFMRHPLWSELLMCGYPFLADPQVQHWYPPAWILRNILHDWNSFTLMVYILSSCFAYGLAYALTKSRLSATIGGIVYGMSGWMMANLVHSGVIHCDIWLPLVIWSFVELRLALTPHWFLIATLGIALMVLAGHPAVAAFLMMSITYWLCAQTLLRTENRLQLGGTLCVTLLLGVGISMVSMLPALEYSHTGLLRLNMSPADLIYYCNPMQIVHFVFPFLFGGSKTFPYNADYFGPKDLQTVSCYMGLSVLVLVLIAIFTNWRLKETKLWVFFCLIMLLLSLGDTTPFGKLVYYLPIYNHIRVPARHFLDFSLGISVLAAMGTAALLTRSVTSRVFGRCCIGVAVLVMILVYPAIVVLKSVREYLKLAANGPAWLDPSVLVPVCVAVAQLPVLYAFFKCPDSKIVRAVLVIFVICDLGSFGWFLPWHSESPFKAEFAPPAHAARYRQLLAQTYQRVLPVRGNCGTKDELFPDQSAMWEIPSASGYLNLVADRFYRFLDMPDGGFVLGDWSSNDNRAIDIAAVRYVFCPKDDPRFPLPNDAHRWRKVEEIGSAVVFENLRATPRAWIVSDVRTLAPHDVLSAVRTSILGGTKSFDPMKTALVEEPCDVQQTEEEEQGKATITKLSSERVEIDTQASKRSFLVLSDSYYPGWHAYIDGTPTKVYRTYYIFRGLPVPAGNHHVVFAFEPMSLYLGASISIFCLVALIAICLFTHRRQRARFGNPGNA